MYIIYRLNPTLTWVAGLVGCVDWLVLWFVLVGWVVRPTTPRLRDSGKAAGSLKRHFCASVFCACYHLEAIPSNPLAFPRALVIADGPRLT